MNKRRVAGSGESGVVHALCYTRVSGAEHQVRNGKKRGAGGAEQEKKQGLSLEAQEAATRRYVASQLGWVLAAEYQDVLSGKRADRPQYTAMLEHARRLRLAGKRAAIVVVRLDRLGRNKAEYFRAADELARQGAEVHSIKDGGVLDETHASILAVFAAKEAALIGERVAETRSHIVTNGWHYGRVPFGYRKRPATPDEQAAGAPKSVLEADPATSGVAAEAFERFAAGASIQAVADWLSRLPERLRGGRAWPAQAVAKLLRSPSYVARPAEGVEDVLERPQARWAPLVSAELWRSVQDRLAGHALRPHQASQRYLLTGFLRCDWCGHRMVAATHVRRDRGERGERRNQYRCTGWQRGANAADMTCRRAFPMRQTDTAVLDQVAAVLEHWAEPARRSGLEREWSTLNRQDTDMDTRRAAELRREIKRLNDRLANAAAKLADGELDRLGYEALRDRELERITVAEAELERLSRVQAPARDKHLPSAQAIFEQAGGWSSALRRADVPEQRAVLDILVESVVATRVGWRRYSAEITWTRLGHALAQVAATGARAA